MTVNNTRLFAGRKSVVQHITIVSDGTEESNLVVYDSSAVATALGLADSTDCKINSIKYSVNGAAAGAHLSFDATTDLVAYALPTGHPMEVCFRSMGGLKNIAGSGKTGDILLTTTGLASGDVMTIILDVDPRSGG